jgi:cyanophycinase
MYTGVIVSMALLSQAAPSVSAGPKAGSLVIDGGGQNAESIRRFVTLAGGPRAQFVLIPTADEDDSLDLQKIGESFAKEFQVENLTVLHTRDRVAANSEEFVAPLKTANAVWFGGGRQWRLVDAYMGTRTQREIEGVLARGGVVGGSSAGATIQGSYLVCAVERC